ncbi:MAG: hypothetical protein WC895_00065 [Candidatus Shapirobacteria bacterium]|jgi:hypothetical protein
MSDKKDPIGNIIIITLLALLSVAGYISYKSIDWTVLKRLEAQPLVLPTPATSPISSPSSTIKN